MILEVMNYWNIIRKAIISYCNVLFYTGELIFLIICNSKNLLLSRLPGFFSQPDSLYDENFSV
jgi:hypothetical protein